jgi:hypothetical protein
MIAVPTPLVPTIIQHRLWNYLGKEKLKLTQSLANKGLDERSEKKPALVPPATVANKTNKVSSTRGVTRNNERTKATEAGSRSKSVPKSSTNRAGSTIEKSKATGTGSRSKSTPKSSTKRAGSTMEKSKATGTGSKAKSTPKSSLERSGRKTGGTAEKSKATGAGSRSKSTPKSSQKKKRIQIAHKKGLLEVVKELHEPVFQKLYHHRRNKLRWQLGWVRKRQLL